MPTKTHDNAIDDKVHLTIRLNGFVQGVGFRPFAARLAKRHLQNGWVANTSEGVIIDIEGRPEDQALFLHDLKTQLPPYAEIRSLSYSEEPLAGYDDFNINASIIEGTRCNFLLPDVATCPDCLQDLFDAASRFYRYPFTSCSHCGPRFSILKASPFDRIHTSMADFPLCDNCMQDYRSLDNRRYHAQTLACPQCGPRLQFLDDSGHVLSEHHDAFVAAVRQLQDGKIIAMKGIGGFQLLVDATNEKAVERLRRRKQRPRKPFAVMTANLTQADQYCHIGEAERLTLSSPAAPIVLLKRRETNTPLPISPSVAPDAHLMGTMLPYSPLHHLLMHEYGSPLVVTSGNRSDEPLCIDEADALDRLRGIADYYLTHNRSIMRPLDDSIVRVLNGKPTLLRRARGYCSLPIAVEAGSIANTVAVGGQLKNAVALSYDNYAILSQHLGDMANAASQQHFRETLTDLQRLYHVRPKRVMHDCHPDYAGSHYAAKSPGVKTAVQHHYAHALSCMAENSLEPPTLAVVWDGSGFGDDQTLWGGEFLLIHQRGYRRFGHLRSFSLPGGSQAIREPRRAALGLLYEMYADDAFTSENLYFDAHELTMIKTALTRRINCPKTTSVGRFFDVAASLLGLCQRNAYEGQAAALTEAIASGITHDECYPFELKNTGNLLIIDWQDTVAQLLSDRMSRSTALIAAKFHNTLAAMMVAVADRAGQKNIVLSGGCFQNALLVEKSVKALENAGFTVYCHEKIPPNDGGLALGQLVAANYLNP